MAGYNIDGSRVPAEGQEQGRWPANVIHDGSEEVMQEFAKYGVSGGGSKTRKNNKNPYGGRSLQESDTPAQETVGYSDRGTIARYYYCAKANKSERTHGGRVPDDHPTVKPVALMRYLARLTKTPYGGVVLDPFMGSGTTGIAAYMEGRSFVGIEQDEGNFDIAAQRLSITTKDAPVHPTLHTG